MPEANHPIENPEGNKIVRKESSEFKLLLQKVMADEHAFNLTEAQIDETLAQRRQVHEYIHKERMQKHEQFKLSWRSNLIGLCGTLIFIFTFGILIFIYRPEYIQQFLSAVLGFFGGYGFAKGENNLKNKE